MSAPHDPPAPPSSAAPTVIRRLLIHGRVQGVYYRVNAQSEALRLKLRGWVRNRHGGAVEAVVAGPAEAVDSFTDWARRGPAHARVDHIDIEELPDTAQPEAAPFAIWPTV